MQTKTKKRPTACAQAVAAVFTAVILAASLAPSPTLAYMTAGATNGPKAVAIAKAKPKISLKATKTVKYTGRVAVPTVTVKSGRKTLEEGKDYKLSYLSKAKKKISAKKVKKPGTYFVKVTGRGKYKGATKIAKFKVWSKNGMAWVPETTKRVWVPKIVEEPEVEQEAYTSWEFDRTEDSVNETLGDGTLITLGSEDYTRLYFLPDRQAEADSYGYSYDSRFYYIDGKYTIQMPAEVLDFFKSWYAEYYDDNSSLKWSELIMWADEAGFSAERTARTMRFFDTRLGPIELDGNGEWKDSEKEKYQKYIDALEPIMPKLKEAAEGAHKDNAHGGHSGWHFTADVLTNRRLVNHPTVYKTGSYTVTDQGHYENVVVRAHWG